MNGATSTARLPAVRRAAIGAADQILYSLTNFVVTAFVAHFSSTSQFGAYAVLYACFMIISGIHRGIVCEPLIIRFSAASREAVQSATILSLRRSLIIGVTIAVLFFIGTCFGPNPIRPLGFVFAAGLVILLLQDALRYAALAGARPTIALANDAIVVVAQGFAYIIIVAIHAANPTTLAIAWVVASGAGAAVGMVLLGFPKSAPQMRLPQSKQSHLAATLGVDNAIVLSSQQATGFVLAAVSGLSAAGALRVAQTAYAPLTTLLQGLQAAVTPELVRLRAQSFVTVMRALRLLALGLFGLAIAFVILIALLPAGVGSILFGASWDVADGLLLPIGLAQVAGVPTVICQAAMRSFGDGTRILKARLIGVVGFAGIATALASAYHIEGAGVGLAIGSTLQSVVWALFFRASYRSQCKQQPTLAAPTPTNS